MTGGYSAANADFSASLVQLGFSQYEARCYVGLLAPEPQTGYGVAKATGVPQPKVYEALRKLVSRGAAREIAGEPVRFVPVPPAALLADLKQSFEARLADADVASRTAWIRDGVPVWEPYASLTTRDQTLEAATGMLRNAKRRIYVSASSEELKSLRKELLDTVARGVDGVVLAFGAATHGLDSMRVFRHASTDGMVYRHHQARHLAVVVDSRETVFSVAADGKTWKGVKTDNEAVIAAVKGFIRHDIDMQQVFADFGKELVDAYGPGLQGLETYRQDPARTEPEPAVKPTRKRTRSA